MDNTTPIKIEISHRTILFTLLILAGSYVLFRISDILILLFIAFMVSVAMGPLVAWLHRHHLPKNLAITLAYLVMIGSLVAIIAAIIPPLVTETANLINQIPIPQSLADDIKHWNIDAATLNTIASQLNSIPNVLGFIGSTVTFFTVLVTMTVMSFYFLKERQHLHKNLVWLFGANQTEKQAEKFVDRIDAQIGGWVRGELFLMLIVGVLTYGGLLLLNVNYALPLAIIAGLLEILPNIGPTISAIPAIIIAFLTGSPTMAVAVTALYILIQQLENSLIVPFVMKRAVGINPIATIIIILVGYRLGGVGGAALAIPLFLTAKVILAEYIRLRPKA